MKFRKTARRAAAVLTASALALCACFGGVLAEEETTTTASADDAAQVRVYNVEEGATVTAYQIVDATYNSYGLTGFEAVSGVTVEDPENVTSDEITEIAQDINNGTLTLSSVTLIDYTQNTDETSEYYQKYYYYASLTAGSWVILVTGTSTETYNPMLVSVNYADANDSTTIGGTVDADGNYQYDEVVTSDDGTTTTNVINAYAKSSEVSVKKSITSSLTDRTVNVGDSVGYEISTTIPDYSDAYDETTLVFTLTDTWQSGLDTPSSVTVAVGSTDSVTVPLANDSYTDGSYTDDTYTITLSDGVYTATTEDDETLFTLTLTETGDKADGNYVLAFDADYIAGNAGSSVTVTYSQTVLSDAVADTTDITGGNNTVTLEYTSEQSTYTTEDGTSVEVPVTDICSDEENVYSFQVNGELIKVDGDGEALAGATFTLYTDEDCTTEYENTILTDGTTVSADENGYIILSGLAEGTYYLIETDAPDGYNLNDTLYTIKIDATLQNDELYSYTLTISYGSTTTTTNTYTYTVDQTEDSGTYGQLVLSSESSDVTTVVNNTIFDLPSTGGTGTVVFTAVGILLIAAAACVFVVFYKKQKNADQ